MGTPSSSTDGFVEFTVDPSHPFYIHPTDSPGSQLVAIPFYGTSFVHWRSSMLTSLSTKNKLGIMTGKVAQHPPNSPYYPFWERCNDMVKAWITNSLPREIAASVMCLSTAREVWSDINERFGQSNGSKYIQIQREISSTSQGSSDIATYFTRMRALWDELNSFYVGLICSCGTLPKFIEDQHLFQFLSGLNESYSTVKSSIMLMSLLPSISKAYSLLQYDESQKENQPPNLGFSGSLFLCLASTARNLGTHQTNRLHGFPTDFKFTKNKRFVSASCAQVEDNVSQVVLPNETTTYGFNKEQYQHLMSLFQQAHISTGNQPSTSGDNIAFANFAGPFSEEATGNW
uniref:Uncharacterized protein LOC104227083 n=1 Tax=Nicotiana sylvestris TaxID=4096 RepID=A0A1U7WS57_NICSY|nr:PREDICTED: uncharacterized protein LOC104227083 [Nicotiana sylvestris]